MIDVVEKRRENGRADGVDDFIRSKLANIQVTKPLGRFVNRSATTTQCKQSLTSKGSAHTSSPCQHHANTRHQRRERVPPSKRASLSACQAGC